jgi:hypothetical protein
MWNIQGFTQNKIIDQDFVNFISKMHVLSLVETWSDSGKPENSIAGFTLLCNNTRIKHKKPRRCSGGIAVYIKNDLSKGVSKLAYSHSDIVWIKIDKTFFHLKKDIFLAVMYFSLENSSGASDNINDLYSKLLNNIEFYSQLGEVVVQCDFNAYAGSIPDFVLSDNSPYPNSDDPNYFIDSCIPRNSLV